jgi:tetratricopeptide (TPR) repeat protein
MKVKHTFLGAFFGIFLAANVFAAETNQITNQISGLTREEMTNNFQQIQAQLSATQLAVEQSRQTSDSNASALAAHFQVLEQAVVTQHLSDSDAVRRTQTLTLLVAAVAGLAGIGILLLIYFQWRAFTQFVQISVRPQVLNGHGHEAQQIAAAGRVAVESSNNRWLDAVGQLEKRIDELEVSKQLPPAPLNGHPQTNGNGNGKPVDELAAGQKHLDANQPQQALEFFENYLTTRPDDAKAILKKAEALEKLGRDEQALTHYNRAIAADNTLAIAHLHKGGLLNRLRRYDEAFNCYEQALLAQDRKKPAGN